jgi:hypothetical protein
MTWEEIRKEFLKELIKHEERLEKSLRNFSEVFLKRLKEQGYQITPELEAKLSEFVQKEAERLRGLLARVAKAVAVHTVGKKMRDEFIARVVGEVFERRWADGRNLSERIWWINDEIREGMKRVLSEGIRQARAIQHMVYEMQYEIERSVGGRFAQVTTDRIPKWLDDLWETGVKAARDPFSRKTWENVMKKVEEHVEKLSRTGSYYETKRLLNEIRKAVEQGMDELIGKAVNRWLYDRQLYYLKRVARTESANAFHLAQIKATEEDPEVIGYQWKLSKTHPKADICDFYASVEFGLGKGVWPKDRVPRTKPHPHCLCYLIPRVTPVKTRGAVSFREFWEELPESKKKEVLPRWASKLAHAGVDPNEFLREGEFVKKEEFLRRLGEEKFEALSAVGSALEEVKWRELERHVEVRKEYVKNARELNEKFDRILKQKKAKIYAIKHKEKGYVRFYAISEDGKEVAIFDRDGTRASWFPLDKRDFSEFIEYMKNKTGGRQRFTYIGTREELWKER